MNRLTRQVFSCAPVVLLLGTPSLKATPVTVEETGIGANEIVNMTSTLLGRANVYAGIVNLQVNGVAMQGFCIDPFHWSLSGPQDYSMVPLTGAPKAPGGPMDAATALKIEQLWAYDFKSNMGNVAAAGLQIAIWDLVSTGANSQGTFTLNGSTDYGARGLLNWLTGNPDAPAADLVGLTGPGQDYVIPNVPDGGTTIIMMVVGLFGLFAARRALPGLRGLA